MGAALTALRSLGAEAVRLLFTQEMERARHIAMEKGAIPALAKEDVVSPEKSRHARRSR